MTLGTILLIVLVVAIAAAAFAAGAEAKRIVRCNGQKVLCDQPFNEIVLAGAHNAMSTDSLGWVLPNQSIAIPDQLHFGIRALLVDTYYGRLRDNGIVENTDRSDPEARTYLCHVYCQLGASRLAPMSSTPNFSSTPSRARSSAQLSAVCPPMVGSRASGRSRSMILATVCQRIGSM